MEGQPKVSVIIPVYNAEKYLKEAIDSVIAQTFTDLEIICVNDGSTDHSAEILQEYKAKDTRIQVYSQANGGASVARNEGLKHATGDYVYFFDSDDLIIPDALRILYNSAINEDADVVLCSAKSIYESDELRKEFPQYMNYYKRSGVYRGRMNGLELFRKLKENDEYFCQPCCYFVNRDFLISNEIEFCQGIIREDEIFAFSLLLYAQRALCIKDELFVRRVRDNSVMTGSSYGKQANACLQASVEMYRLASRVKMDRELTRIVAEHCAGFAKAARSQYNHILPEESIDIQNNNTYGLMYYYFQRYLNSQESELIIPSAFARQEILNEKDNNRCKATIVVPVYNAELYLNECLDSLVNQTVRDIEIICINDGSTDQSLKILKEYAAKDKRIRVIDQQNHGHGYTMNVGISNATGETVMFVDSDDFIETDAIERLYPILKKNRLDFVKCDLQTFTGDHEITGKMNACNNRSHYNRIINPNKVYSSYFAPTQNVTALYNTNFLHRNEVTYGTEHKCCQDIPFFFKAMYHATRIAYYDYKYYWYRKGLDAALTNSRNQAQDAVDTYQDVCSYFEEIAPEDKSIWRIIQKKQLDNYVYIIKNLSGSDKLRFIEDYSAHLRVLEEQGELDTYFFNNKDKALVSTIMQNPSEAFICFQNENWKKASAEIFETYQTLDKLRIKNEIHELMEKRCSEREYHVAVIIPVYNAEDYLRVSLDSVLEQTLNEKLQVICVDDGSTDNSLKVLYEYAKRDDRVYVYTQENKGAGMARNLALSHVHAEFVAFMDADDYYYSANALKSLYSKAIETGYSIVAGFRIKDRKGSLDTINVENPSVIGECRFTENPIDYGYQSYIFNMDMLRKNRIEFPDYRRYQDPPFFVKAMIAADNYYVLNQTIYVYRVRVGHVRWDEIKVVDYARGLREELQLATGIGSRLLMQTIYDRLKQDAELFCSFMVKSTKLIAVLLDIDKIFENENSIPYRKIEPLRLFEEKGQTGVSGFSVNKNDKNTQSKEADLKKITLLENRIDRMRSTASWKIGRTMTWIPRKIRGFIRVTKKAGLVSAIQQSKETLEVLPINAKKLITGNYK